MLLLQIGALGIQTVAEPANDGSPGKASCRAAEDRREFNGAQQGCSPVSWAATWGRREVAHPMHTNFNLQTMLTKVVATECNTFFNISASSIVSKWCGDSYKLVKVLFELARHQSPSTIFLDEIDAIISQRGEARSEHEASQRLRTELLIQILVPLPEAEARHAMFEELLPSTTSNLGVQYDILFEKTEGYSGSDIRLVCKEAAMQPL